MKINWKIRLADPLFIAQLILAVFLPVLTYMGLTLEDLTTWTMLGTVIVDAAKNPYILGLIVVNVYNVFRDPTTPGFSDSQLVMNRAKEGDTNEDITELH